MGVEAAGLGALLAEAGVRIVYGGGAVGSMGALADGAMEVRGLPPGGGDWTCHKVVKNGVPTWVCYGTTEEGGTPPGGSGWQCIKVKTEFGKDLYKRSTLVFCCFNNYLGQG